jgi:hypothetical protein
MRLICDDCGLYDDEKRDEDDGLYFGGGLCDDVQVICDDVWSCDDVRSCDDVQVICDVWSYDDV